MDEFAVKKGHRNYATVIVDLERVEIIDILDYREQKKLIDYFENRGADWCKEIEVFCSDMWRGFFGTAKSVFPNATLVVDRFHFFGYLNKAIDNERKALRRKFKTQEEFKRLKWALLKDPTGLTDTQKNKLDKVFLLCPQLKLLYNQKEKIRFIFNKRLTHEQGEIELNKWIDEAKKLNNRYLNTFLEMLNKKGSDLANLDKADLNLIAKNLLSMNTRVKACIDQINLRNAFSFNNADKVDNAAKDAKLDKY